MNNLKKEFPQSGLEQDCTSKWGRKYLCFVHNVRGIKKFVKTKMNRRFRRFNKKLPAQKVAEFWNSIDD